MFRNMRRKNQLLTKEQCETIINKTTSGVLSLLGDDGYPYGVPLSYVYENGKIYFHSAKSGHKVDAVKNNPKASFTVVAKDDVKGDEFTTSYASVIAFGKVRILEDSGEIRNAIEMIGSRYAPNGMIKALMDHIEKYWNQFYIIEFDVENMTGKASKDHFQK